MMKLYHCAAASAATIALAYAASHTASGQDETPQEFGDVAWGDRLDDAQRAAAESKKPILLFFQEVPG